MSTDNISKNDLAPGEEPNKGGRPTIYKAKYNEEVYKLCLLGATDKEIAANFEVAESTINAWKLKHKGFSEAVKAGKLKADSNVAESFYKRATGYEFSKVTYEKRDTIEALGLTSN